MTRRGKIYHPGHRLRRATFFVTGLLVLLGALGLDAHSRSLAFEAERPTMNAVVHQLGFADLALSSSARWLRTPSQSERSAPLTDAPLSFDTDPAGAALGPVE